MTSQFWYNKLKQYGIRMGPQESCEEFQETRCHLSKAATVFGDPLAITFQDPDHSVEEDRQLKFGQSLQRRLIVVSHTKRGERTRIINARLMGRNERVIYEES